MRIIYANDRMYTVMVVGTNVSTTTPIVQPFFDSLQFD